MLHAVVGSDFAENEVGELTDEIYERLGIRIEIRILIISYLIIRGQLELFI